MKFFYRFIFVINLIKSFDKLFTHLIWTYANEQNKKEKKKEKNRKKGNEPWIQDSHLVANENQNDVCCRNEWKIWYLLLWKHESVHTKEKRRQCSILCVNDVFVELNGIFSPKNPAKWCTNNSLLQVKLQKKTAGVMSKTYCFHICPKKVPLFANIFFSHSYK